jgi:hypothetical protein
MRSRHLFGDGRVQDVIFVTSVTDSSSDGRTIAGKIDAR